MLHDLNDLRPLKWPSEYFIDISKWTEKYEGLLIHSGEKNSWKSEEE